MLSERRQDGVDRAGKAGQEKGKKWFRVAAIRRFEARKDETKRKVQ